MKSILIILLVAFVTPVSASQVVNAKYAISYDVNGNITGSASNSNASQIEFPSDTDSILTFNNEKDFIDAKQPKLTEEIKQNFTLSNKIVNDLTSGVIHKATSQVKTK